MDFHPHKAIFLQIADLMCENILLGTWAPGTRIPSVRDLAVTLEVNPNTVLRAFSSLEEAGIIANSRGIGYFAESKSKDKIITLKRKEFFTTDLPRLAKTMDLLGITFKELQQLSNKANK